MNKIALKMNLDVAGRDIIGWMSMYKNSVNLERANKMSRSLKREEFLDDLSDCPYPIASCCAMCVHSRVQKFPA